MTSQVYQEDSSIPARLAEIEIKMGRIRTLLEREGLAGVLLMKHPNYSWVTAGGKSFVANCFDKGEIAILVTQTARYAFCSIIEEPRVIAEEQLPALGFEVMTYGWEENRVEELTAHITGDITKVGCDLPLGAAQVMNEKLNPLRYSLTDNEIGRYCYLGENLSAALEAYLPTVRPGMTEYEITGGICEVLWKHNIEQVMHLVSADERAYTYRHGLPTAKVMGNHLIVSINGRYKGLVATVSRMVHFGKINSGLLRQYDDCCTMECIAISKARVGADEIESYHALKQAYLDYGYPTMFAKHGQGGCQGYWPRDYMVTPSSHHIIAENQAYCYNPVVDGTKTEDSFIVTAQGPLFITAPVTYPKIGKEIDGIGMERPGLLVVD